MKKLMFILAAACLAGTVANAQHLGTEYRLKKVVEVPGRQGIAADKNFFYVGCWEYQGNDDTAPVLNKEPLEYEIIKVQTRNYKN